MLNGMVVAGTATYSSEGERFDGLKQVNFVYGSNGSGKTTISRALASPPAHPSCRFEWRGGQNLEPLVYNSDFTAGNFAEATTPGIFTLGQDSVEARERIAELKTDIDAMKTAISRLQFTRSGEDNNGGKIGDRKSLRQAFEETCWAFKVTHDEHFVDAFEGLRSNKVKFCDRILAENEKNTETLHPIETLKERAATVFDKSAETIASLPSIEFVDLITVESAPVLGAKIVGSTDIDIGGLIERLGASDWVKKGLDYLPSEDGPCPFCQQDVPPGLVAELNAYFDDTYMAQIAEIDRLIVRYRDTTFAVTARLDELLEHGCTFLDAGLLRTEIERLEERLRSNSLLLEGKRAEPSAPVSLESVVKITGAIAAMIERANEKIAAHNAMVKNLDAERTRLKSQIWNSLVHEGSTSIALYLQQKNDLDAAVSGLDNGIARKSQQLREARNELADLESQITSVEPTVTKINDTLASFGFTNFRLATVLGDEGLYRCVRDDGSDVGRTLSEGEKGFVTFLYFYSSIRGSTTQTGMNRDRLIVLDDPVSSFDSDVLFVVSAMIRSLIDEACAGNGQVKQVVVLTHNIYFHKEVSFDHKRARDAKQTFWVVRKIDGVSTIKGFDRNPIRSSYELLWDEVRSPAPNMATIPNTLRRILENYFTIFGGVDRSEIVELFDDDEKLICASLFSWINAGSHSIMDDLSVATDEGLATRYLKVFEKIFTKTNHEAHYRMMFERPG